MVVLAIIPALVFLVGGLIWEALDEEEFPASEFDGWILRYFRRFADHRQITRE
jgi:hypothetical protein